MTEVVQKHMLSVDEKISSVPIGRTQPLLQIHLPVTRAIDQAAICITAPPPFQTVGFPPLNALCLATSSFPTKKN